MWRGLRVSGKTHHGCWLKIGESEGGRFFGGSVGRLPHLYTLRPLDRLALPRFHEIEDDRHKPMSVYSTPPFPAAVHSSAGPIDANHPSYPPAKISTDGPSASPPPFSASLVASRLPQAGPLTWLSAQCTTTRSAPAASAAASTASTAASLDLSA